MIQPSEAGARAQGNYFQRVKRTIGLPEVFRTRSCSCTVAAWFFLALSRAYVYTNLYWTYRRWHRISDDVRGKVTVRGSYTEVHRSVGSL